MNIFLILKYGLSPAVAQNACIVEFGSYKGGSALFMAWIVNELYPGMKVYALDTFEGMPETDASLDFHVARDFRDTSLSEMRQRIAKTGLDNIVPVKGKFEDTWPELAPELPPVALAHIDRDIYGSVVYASQACMPKMADGGYIIYDDPLVASCPGAFQAVEDTMFHTGLHAEQIAPHLVFRYPPLAAIRRLDKAPDSEK